MKFDHANKWYVHNSESDLKNEMHIILWDSEIQKYQLFQSRLPDIVIINEKRENEPAVWLTMQSRQNEE